MSELNERKCISNMRAVFLVTSCAAALLSCLEASAQTAENRDGDYPTVWIELGGQLERVTGGEVPFAPAFTDAFPSEGLTPVEQSQRPARYSNGFEGALEFAPRHSRWVFDVSLRYGRSNMGRTSHDQTATPAPLHFIESFPDLGLRFENTLYPKSRKFEDTDGHANESHAIVDFQVGSDVGLGLFGGSTFANLGLRYAQFMSKSDVQITANPGGTVPIKYLTDPFGLIGYAIVPELNNEIWNIYHASATISRSFRGVGPSVSFGESIRLAGRPDETLVDLDMGLNGSVLFGRQKASVHERIYDDRPVTPHPYNFIPMTTVYHHRYDRVRSRTVVVPNLGGFAGLSFNYSNAKIKLGYRADFFFGAMDGGIDTRKTYDRDFYGPFATISIGLGG